MTETVDRHEQMRQERRRQVLDSALVECAEKGFQDANVSAIASRANVSQGTIYWYFESKKALVLELIAAVSGQVVLPLDRILGNTDVSPLDRLLQVLRTSLALSRSTAGKFRLLLNLWSQPALFDPEAEETLLLDRIWRDRILAPLSQVIQEGMDAGEIADTDPEALTVAIGALFDGLMIGSLVWPEGLVSDERLEAVMHFLQPAP